MGDDLQKALTDMEMVGDVLGFIEKRIYWEFGLLTQRINPEQNPALAKALRVHVADFLHDLANSIEDECDHSIQ